MTKANSDKKSKLTTKQSKKTTTKKPVAKKAVVKKNPVAKKVMAKKPVVCLLYTSDAADE